MLSELIPAETKVKVDGETHTDIRTRFMMMMMMMTVVVVVLAVSETKWKQRLIVGAWTQWSCGARVSLLWAPLADLQLLLLSQPDGGDTRRMQTTSKSAAPAAAPAAEWPRCPSYTEQDFSMENIRFSGETSESQLWLIIYSTKN